MKSGMGDNLSKMSSGFIHRLNPCLGIVSSVELVRYFHGHPSSSQSRSHRIRPSDGGMFLNPSNFL